MAKGKRDGLLEGNQKKTSELVQSIEKQKEIIRKLEQTKIKMNK